MVTDCVLMVKTMVTDCACDCYHFYVLCLLYILKKIQFCTDLKKCDVSVYTIKIKSFGFFIALKTFNNIPFVDTS